MDDVNSMFSNIDELRKNGWIQIQSSTDEVPGNIQYNPANLNAKGNKNTI